MIDRSIASHRSITTAYATVVHSLWATGRPISAIEVADAGMAQQIRPGQALDEKTNVFLYGRFRALLFAGLTQEAGELATNTYNRAQEARWTRGLPYWAYCLGLANFWMGRVNTAIGWLQEANRGKLGSDPSFLRVSGVATLVMASLLAGRPTLAAEAQAELDSFDEGYGINQAWPARFGRAHV